MANLFDYLYWRGDIGTRCLPFNPVDGLILAWFSSVIRREIVPGTVGEAAEEALRDVQGELARLARSMAESPRFRHMSIMNFRRLFSEEEELQFGAMTVLTNDGCAYVVYRGTDATLVGWKEDFNMAFSDEVPAQREALAYLNEAARMTHLPIRVGGHSKGGNLAVYASACCRPAVQQRIAAVYNFDGPGLSESVAGSAGYHRIEPRIETFLPESSIVGILLERSSRYLVVKSDAIGPLQHSPDSWQVTPDGFETAASLDWGSLYADRTIRAWLNSMSIAERKTVIDGLYDAATSTGAKTIGELAENWRKTGRGLLNGFAGLDLRTQAVLIRSFAGLAASAVREFEAP